MKRGFIFLVVSLLILSACTFNKQSANYNFKENDNQNKNLFNEVAGNNCEGSGTVNFTSPPMKLEDIGFIDPMGLMIGNHVTPIDHGYYYQKDFVPDPHLSDLKEVLAPADGIITSIQGMPTFFSHVKDPELGDYRIILTHTCSFYTIYIHVYKLSDKLQSAVGDIKPSENKNVKILVKAGEVIGKANSFDFSVHNENIILKGFIVPEHYKREPWKIHTVDPFDYFVEPLRSKLLEKDLRQAEPRGGKIDYDIDGKLIGNWFVENTNGYMGIKQPDYWGTHFAIAPNALDPEHIIISLGNFKGEAKQFAIRGNSPNPAEVGIDSGIIKYELIHFNYVDNSGNLWTGSSYIKGLKVSDNGEVEGTLLLQLLDKRKLKLEIFPDKSASEVTGFTNNAVVYER